MPIRAIVAALIVACCWGGNFSATKLALGDLPPMLLLLVRFVAVAALLAPFALREKPRPNLRDMLIVSTTLIVMQFGCLFTALHFGLSITSTIIATQMGVPFACLLSAILYKDYLGPWRSAGLMVAMMGVITVAGTPNASEHWGAFLIAMGGAFSWSVANIRMKRMNDPSVLALQFWPSLFAVPQLLALSLLFEQDQWTRLQAAHTATWIALLYSTFISSLLGYGLWNWLIKRYPLSQVVPYSLFVPVAGISAGAAMFHDPITARMLLGTGLTILGVAIISIRRPKLVEPEMG